MCHRTTCLAGGSAKTATQKVRELYHWFLPLLRLDTVPKFAQLIKLAQEKVGLGDSRVRTPRLPLAGEELQQARQLIAHPLANRPLQYAQRPASSRLAESAAVR